MLKNNLLYLLFTLLIIGASSCEKIADDELPTPAPTDPSGTNPGKVIYTYQNSEVAIDPTQFISVLDIKSYNLASIPIHGTVLFLPEGILHYIPNENVIEADEELVIELLKNDNTKIKETITIKIVQNQAQLPCLIAAMTDKVKTDINKEITVDVLDNDEVCEGVFQEIILLSKPINGTATVINNKINYVPKPMFKGTDKFMYAFVIELNGKKLRRPGFVSIEIENKSIGSGGGTTCTTMLRNDIFELFSAKDTILIPVLVNDFLCPDDLIKGKLSIGTAPFKGEVSVIKDRLIFYKINKPTIPPIQTAILDSFTYKFINALGEVKTAKVKLLAKKQEICKLSALGDNYEFKISSLTGQTFVELDVLKNDIICMGQIKLLKILGNSTYITVTNDKKIRYSPPKFKNETLKIKYQITDDKGVSSISGDVRIKFVD